MVRVGAEIDPSFNSTMDSASGKLGEFSDKAGGVGDAFAAASGKVTDAIPGVTSLGDEAETASKKLGDMVEGLLALGEALVIGEAMKEFAGDALSVYTNIEKASTSLTALTGSAGVAKSTIEGLKDLALNDALSFPSLVQAAQKMTALGFTTGQVNTILQTAGDTAAATGGDISNVASAIDRMVLSGNTSARVLSTLGISTGDLGKAMDVTQGNVTSAFKALDQSGRIDALNTALNKFSGVAVQVAQTVAGQWQILQTQWEGVLESIGAALAPVAKQVIAFLSTNVVPFFQSMVEGFSNLSPGMQQFVVIAGAAVPAVAALALGLAGVGAAFTALAGMGAVIGVLGLVGAAIEGIHLSGMDTAAMSLYHAIADNFPNVPGMFGSIGAAVESAAGKFGTWASGILNQTPLIAGGFQGVQDDLDRIFPSIARTDIAGWLKAAVDPAALLKIGVNELADAIQYLGGNYQSMAAQVTLQVGLLNAANDQFNHNMAAQAGAFTSTGIQLSAIAKAYQTLKDNLTDAQTKLGDVKTAFDNGQASLGQYAAAQGAVEAAQLALNPNFQTQKQALTDLKTATTDLNNSQTTLDSLLKTLPGHILSVSDAQNNLRQAQSNADGAASSLATAQQNLNAAIALGPGHTKDLTDAENALKTAETGAKDAKTGLEQATKNLSTAQGIATQFAKDQATTDSDYATMLNTLGKGAVNTYADAFTNLAKAQSAYYSAVTNEGTIQDQLNQLFKDGKQDTSDYKDAQGALAIAHGVVVQAQKNVNAAQSDANPILTELQKGSTDLAKADQALADLYEKSLNPDLIGLKGALDNARDAKIGVTNAGNALNASENGYKDVLMDFMLGSASLADVTAALNLMNAAKVTLTGNEKLLNDAVSILTGSFGLSSVAVKKVTSDTGDMTTAAQNAKAGFDALKIQSSSDLDDLARKAHDAFLLIQGSGVGSSSDIRQAWIADLTAEKAAMVSHGTDLTTAQQTTLDSLLNQQSYFNQQHADQWHALYTTVDNQIMQLSDKLVQDLFEGTGSFGKTALKALEDLGAAVVNAFIAPATKAIANFIAGSLSDLMGKLGALMGSQGFGGVQNVIGVALPDALTGLDGAFNKLGDTAVSAASQIDQAVGGASGTGAGGASGAVGAIGAVTGSILQSVSSIVGMVTGVISAITGIIQVVQGFSMEDALKAIEKETARMAIYLGDQGANSILGLMWRLAADLEFGMMEKDLNIIAPDMDAILKALGNLTVSGGGGGASSISGVVTVNDPGNVAYLPTTQTNPIPFTDVNAALANYQKTAADYVAGKASGDDVNAAEQAVLLAGKLADAQAKYQADLATLGSKGALSPANLATLASDKQAVIAAQTVTTAGPSTQITTVGELATANQALANINTTLQFSVGLNPWFQTAFQNINDGIVACAGWLQGIAGIMGAVQAAIPTLAQALGSMPGASTGSSDSGSSAGDGSGSSAPTADTDAVAGRSIANISGLIDGWTSTLKSRMSQLDHGFSSMADAFKMTVAVPAFGGSGFTGLPSPALAAAGPSDHGHTFNFYNSKLNSEADGKKILDDAVNQLRRRNRII